MNEFKSPLSIYVLWHPKYEKNDLENDEKKHYGGTEIAHFIYSAFCRRVDNPIERTFGIPVYFRYAQDEEGKPSDIDVDEAERNAFIVLAEGQMLNDTVYRQYVKGIVDNKRPEDHIFMFKLDKYGHAVNPDLQEDLYLDLSLVKDEGWELELEKRQNMIYNYLLHDFSRMLFDMEASYQVEQANTHRRKPPVKLFLSHTKKDGENQVKDFKNHVQGETKLKTFFDVNDIQSGEKIKNEIQHHLDVNTAVVIFQTDEFSNREWCRNEVLWAKRKSSPMVVINDIQKGEKRSFPYLGNVPTIRWSHNYVEILNIILGQVLHQRFWTMFLQNLSEYHKLNEKYDCHYFGRSPELFDFIRVKAKQDSEKESLVIYPDPPLGIEELGLLSEAEPSLHFVTPISLPNIKK